MPKTEQGKKISIADILKHYQKEDAEMLKKAFDVAKKAHEGQRRESGDPYIVHPVGTARILADLRMDAETVAAGFLHDVVDDTDITLEEIEEEFGESVSFLVDGVSKLGKIKYRGAERHAENLRKMLVAMAQEIRVVIIKFADRMHNMQTLGALPERKQKRIAKETLEIYAPIAARLGIAELGKNLEDISFSYIHPKEYEYVKRERDRRLPEAEKYLKKVYPVVKKELEKEGVHPDQIEMRAKHYYSLWRKLEKADYNWEQIQDLVAMRIIVPTVEECYKALGIIHKLWKPLPGRIKDYIALPKPNGYQSLHTTVFCIDGRQIEIQIRTPEMHENAEYGVASHWRYKNKEGETKESLDKTYTWVRQLREWREDNSPTEEFLASLKLDVFSDRIFVFTPQGDVIDLPAGATPIDFAYHIHSDIGNKCTGAKINGQMKALNTELHNGDVIEVITEKNKKPSQTWLTFVVTRAARNNIRRELKKQNFEKNRETGLQLLNNELKALEGKTWAKLPNKKKNGILSDLSVKNEQELFSSLGNGDISIARVLRRIIEEEEEAAYRRIGKRTPKKIFKKEGKPRIRIAGAEGLQTKIAQCCKPGVHDEIIAYITIDKGASIHKLSCKNINKKTSSSKILPAYWIGDKDLREVKLEIICKDRVGLLKNISNVISSMQLNIVSLTAETKKPPKNGGNVVIAAILQIKNLEQLTKLAEKLKRVEEVVEVKRIF